MRVFLAVLAWVGSFAVLVPVAFVVAIVFGGPHSSLLPSWMGPPVFVLGWALLLAGPLLIARAVWRRAGGRRATGAGAV